MSRRSVNFSEPGTTATPPVTNEMSSVTIAQKEARLDELWGDDANDRNEEVESDDSGESEASQKDEVDFDQCQDEDIGGLEAVFQAVVECNIPPPSNAATRVKAKVAEATYLSEKLLQSKGAYDPEVFFICQRYHDVHKREHEALKKAHRRKQEVLYSQLPFRKLLDLILNDQEKTSIGRFIAAIDFLLVLFTIIQLSLETLPRLDPHLNPVLNTVWFNTEMAVTIIFTVETVLRFLVVEDKRIFFKNIYNWLDFFALLPFYLSFFLNNFDVLKVLRTGRFVKLMRNFRHIDALVVTLQKISKSLVAPMVFLALTVLLISAAVYFAEEGNLHKSTNYLDGVVLPPIPNDTSVIQPSDIPFFSMLKNLSFLMNATSNATLFQLLSPAERGLVTQIMQNSSANRFMQEDCLCTSLASYFLNRTVCPQKQSTFTSILDAVWFTVVSMTTVGYGTIVPRCGFGKLIASCGLFLSTIFLAMPIAIVGVSFTESIQEAKIHEMKRKQLNRRNIRQLRMEAELGGKRKIKSRGMVKGVSEALKSGVKILQTSLKLSNESLAQQNTRLKLEKVARLKREADVKQTERDRRGATAAESLLLHLATSLRCTWFNFSSRTGNVDAWSDSKTRSQSLPDSDRGAMSPEVVQQIDSFFSWLMTSWIDQWFTDHQRRILLGDARADGAPGFNQPPPTVDKATLHFLHEQYTVVKRLVAMYDLPKLSFLESLSSYGQRKVGSARGLAREIPLPLTAEFRVTASAGPTGNHSVQTDSRDSILHIQCPDLVLSQEIARLKLSRGFLSRVLRISTSSPLSLWIGVNGIRLGPSYSRLKSLAPTQGELDSVATAGQRSTPGAVELETLCNRILKAGDQINFTPILRVPKSSHLANGDLASHRGGASNDFRGLCSVSYSVCYQHPEDLQSNFL
jgi:hypothetical protein